MFFASLIVLPLLVGVVAGALSTRRVTPVVLSIACVALGGAGAVVMAVDAETEDRGASVGFALVGGVVCALLVWAGYGLARLGRRVSTT